MSAVQVTHRTDAIEYDERRRDANCDLSRPIYTLHRDATLTSSRAYIIDDHYEVVMIDLCKGQVVLRFVREIIRKCKSIIYRETYFHLLKKL